MSEPRYTPSLAERRAAIEESDNAPAPDSRVWWRCRDGVWTIHDHSERDRALALDLARPIGRRRKPK